MKNPDVIINNGTSFFITDQLGDISNNSYRGLIVQDTRHISDYHLLIDGQKPKLLSSNETTHNEAIHILTNPPTKTLEEDTLSIIRRKKILEFYNESIEITNQSTKPILFGLTLHIDSDFADLFELKHCINADYCQLPKKRHVTFSHSPLYNKAFFTYDREDFHRRTIIDLSEDAVWNENTVLFQIKLKPQQTWNASLAIISLQNADKKIIHTKKINTLSKAINEWNWSIPKLETDWHDLEHTYRQSISDLAILRIPSKDLLNNKTNLPAAGLPWFMTIFGRDSLITSCQTLLFGKSLAIGALETLTDYQGKNIDPLSEEEPGKILHEMRFGEVAHFLEWVKFPYYGSVDATPLFLITLSEVYRWTGDTELMHKFKHSALSALDWIDTYGDADKDGFVEYLRKSPRGIENQNWRDSRNSMVFQDGTLAEAPIASADVQGYVYDAKTRMSEIAESVWKDKALSEKLQKQAGLLKEKFNRSFWIDEKKFFALGLDKDKKQIDSLSSSIGHLIWSGIVDQDKIPFLIDHLNGTNLYNGWGVRTLGTNSYGYNPIGYHCGTVWPHDNSIIAAGAKKIGQNEFALRIIKDIINAGTYFGHRLPEVFAGYDKSISPFPVHYPTAASPQAWSAGTPLLFLTLLLGLQPDARSKTLHINPILPPKTSYIRLDGVSAFGKHFLIEVTKHSSSIKEVDKWVCHICDIRVEGDHKH